MIYIFDLEGTLTISKWREHLLPDYDAFHEQFPNDKVNIFVRDICNMSNWNNLNSDSVILTGMMEKHRYMAQDYLLKNKIYYDRLIMRPNDNLLPSPEFKMQTIKENFPLAFENRKIVCFDDRLDVCQEFIKNGITTLKVN